MVTIFPYCLWELASLQSILRKLTEKSGLAANKDLVSEKMLVYPPVAAPCVNVSACVCVCARADGLITVASELSGRLSLHPPPQLPILILQAMDQSALRQAAMLLGPWP